MIQTTLDGGLIVPVGQPGGGTGYIKIDCGCGLHPERWYDR